MKQRVVLSGVNFIEGGPLAIFLDALRALTQNFPECEVHALVHRLDLVDVPGVIIHAFPHVKSSWLRRLRFEYIDSMHISRDLKPDLWLSMHDMTPRVQARTQAVYCHNPAPFDRVTLAGLKHSYRHMLFVLLYRYLYGIFIGRNRYVIVQQAWMRDAFRKAYGVRDVIVAHPSVTAHKSPAQAPPASNAGLFRFFYPALPRTFKNIETLLSAAATISTAATISAAATISTADRNFEVLLTVDGTENSYAASLRQRFGHLDCVRWLGAVTREEVFRLYGEVDALVFPSRLETWGMPITEFQATGKPILVADLPYAHETAGTYAAAHFFPHHDAAALAESMRSLMDGTLRLEGNVAQPIAEPFAKDWVALFRILLSAGAHPDAQPGTAS